MGVRQKVLYGLPLCPAKSYGYTEVVFRLCVAVLVVSAQLWCFDVCKFEILSGLREKGFIYSKRRN